MAALSLGLTLLLSYLAGAIPFGYLVARGRGVSLLPESAFSKRHDRGIRTFPIRRQDLRRSLAVVYPGARELRPPAVALIEVLEAYFRRRSRDGAPAKIDATDN